MVCIVPVIDHVKDKNIEYTKKGNMDDNTSYREDNTDIVHHMASNMEDIMLGGRQFG